MLCGQMMKPDPTADDLLRPTLRWRYPRRRECPSAASTNPFPVVFDRDTMLNAGIAGGMPA
jgi:hypothetical protein